MTNDERHILRGLVMSLATAQYNGDPLDEEAVASLLRMDTRPSTLTDEHVATALDEMMARLHGELLISIPFAAHLTGNTPNGIRAAIRRGKLDVLRVDDKTRGVTWASVVDYFGISPALRDEMEMSWRAAAGCAEGPLFMNGPAEKLSAEESLTQ